MARKDKPGIKYFSQDSDHVLNKKIKLIFSEFDSHGPWVWECLKCEIYGKKGYYFDLNDPDELIMFASDVCKKPVVLVNEIISGCVRRGLFDQSVFEEHNVLTSDRFQNNYLDATREKRKKESGCIDIITEYLVIEIGDNEKRIDLISVKNKKYRENIEKYRENNNTSREVVHKGKEIKLNEIKGEGKGETVFTPPLFIDVESFFKDKIPDTFWDFSKCSSEAKNFIDYYAKTDWVTKNGPITNWENAANGWIANDEKFKKEKITSSTGKSFPNKFDRAYMQALSADDQKKYRAHLNSIGIFFLGKDTLGNSKWGTKN